MDRTYVNQQKKTPVFPLGLELWCKVVIRHRVISSRLRTILLDLVYRERTGEVIDKSLMKSITQVCDPSRTIVMFVHGVVRENECPTL